jgi:hypothetical protein
MGRFETTLWTDQSREGLMYRLRDREACAGWAPFPFTVSGFAGDRLGSGSQARDSGSLGAGAFSFDVRVHTATECRLAALRPCARGAGRRLHAAARPTSWCRGHEARQDPGPLPTLRGAGVGRQQTGGTTVNNRGVAGAVA